VSAPPARPLPLAVLSLLLRAPLAALAGFELLCVRLFHVVVRPRYRIEGRCQHNGVCCHHILVVEGRWMALPVVGALLRLWLGGIHRFRATANLVELPDGTQARIHTCDNLDDRRRCREYWLRPLVCRGYPRPGYFAPPALHRGCGYRVVDRASGEVLAGGGPPHARDDGAPVDRAALVDRWRRGDRSTSRRGSDAAH
jgi:hypothetical protein